MTINVELPDDFINKMRDYSLVYVATPYSKYEEGLDVAHKHACTVTGELLKFGINAYSPIAYTHQIAQHANIDPLDHQFWMRVDKPFMQKADALIVVQMDGWMESLGVNMEIMEFREAGKPIEYLRFFEPKVRPLTQAKIVQNIISSLIILSFTFLLYIVMFGGR